MIRQIDNATGRHWLCQDCGTRLDTEQAVSTHRCSGALGGPGQAPRVDVPAPTDQEDPTRAPAPAERPPARHGPEHRRFPGPDAPEAGGR